MKSLADKRILVLAGVTEAARRGRGRCLRPQASFTTCEGGGEDDTGNILPDTLPSKSQFMVVSGSVAGVPVGFCLQRGGASVARNLVD